MLPLLAGAAALLLMLGSGSSSSAKSATTAKLKPKPKPAAPKSAPRSVPKSAPLTATKMTIGPVVLLPKPKPKVAPPSNLNAPLAKSASQGGGPGLAAPLSADIPADTLKPAPLRPAQPPRSQSPGYKPDAARRGAASLAAHLKRTGKAGYDRRMLKTWQLQAGTAADGLYGPGTRGALIFYGQKDPPAAFTGSGTTPFSPPR